MIIRTEKTAKGAACVVQRFDGFDEFVEFTAKEGPNDPDDGSKQTVSATFHGKGNTWEKTRELAEKGWAEGVEKIERARSLLALPERAEYAERLLPHWDVAGDEVDVGRFVGGEPECMVEFRPSLARARGKCVRFFVNMSASCGFGSDVLERRGALIACLVDILECAGYRVEVWMGASGSRSIGNPEQNAVETVIKLKSFDQRLELDRMAFALCHPCMFRRLVFRAWEHCTQEHFAEGIKSYYAYPANTRTGTVEEGGFTEENTVTFSSTDWGKFTDDKSAVDFVRQEVAKFIVLEDSPVQTEEAPL